MWRNNNELIFVYGNFLCPFQCSLHHDYHLWASKTKGQNQFFLAEALYSEVCPSIQKDEVGRNRHGRWLVLLLGRIDKFGMDSYCGGIYFERINLKKRLLQVFSCSSSFSRSALPWNKLTKFQLNYSSDKVNLCQNKKQLFVIVQPLSKK